MKKRILSIILALCMVAAMVPAMPTTVSAADTCTCLIRCTDVMDADCPVCSREGATTYGCLGRNLWGTIKDTDGLQNAMNISAQYPTVYFRLEEDLTLTNSFIQVPRKADAVLDLNGHTITANQTEGASIFRVFGRLTIIDTQGGGRLKGATSYTIRVIEYGRVYIKGGTIEQTYTRYAVFVADSGRFEMTGGTINIVNNDSRIKYGGIRIEDNGIVTISGDARITGRDWHRLYIESGKLYADGGTIELGMTIRSNGTVDSTHSGTGTVIRGSVENNGTISAGQYTGEVSNCILISEDNEILGEGTINGGSFAGKVSNTSLIKDGTFNSEVDNQGTISGGTFLGTVETENGTIEDSAKVSVNFVNEAGETIKTVRVLRGQRITLADLPEIDPTPYGYRKVKYSVGNTEYREEDKFIDEVRFTEDETVVTVTLIHPITYKITYDLNGGSIQHLEREYQVTSDDITLGTPTKDGYAFIGWGGTGLDGENNMTVTIPKGSTGDREYTAYYWKNLGGDLMSPDYSYTVVYDTQGGSPVEPKTVPKLLASATKVLDGADTTRAGYMFAEWYCGNKRIALQDTTVKDLADRADNGVITITAHWREKLEVSFNTAAQECTYDGTAKAFEIKDTTLDGFQVTYRKNGNTVTAPINAGSYDVIVTREEDQNYKAVNMTVPGGLVIQPKTVEATISTIPDQTYTGKEIKPAITVSDGIDEMPASEYTVDYADNRNAGTATVTVTAKEGGNYTFPQITRNFTIKQKSINPAVTMADYVYGTDPDYPELSGNDGGGTVSVYYSTSDDIADNTAHRVLWDENFTATTLNMGTYYMMAEVAETQNYTSGISPVISFNVMANQYAAPAVPTLNGSTVTVSAADRSKALEYAVSGGDWVDVPALNNGSFVPAGLADNTGYTLSLRVKASADGNYAASDAVDCFFVAYNANGGTGTVSGASASSGNAVTVASGDRLGRDGYTFGGWNTEADGTGTAYTPGSSVTTGATLYAQWTANRYTVTFDTVGGTEIASKTTVQWTDAVLDGVSEPTRDGWKFTGWKYGDVTVTPQTTYKELAVDGSVSSIELKAQWEDIAAPTGEIRIGENSWKEFLNKITFGLFFKDTQTVTITARDNSGEPVTVSYLLSDKALTEDELAAKEFTAYTGGFTMEPNHEWIIYAKLTDQAGNTAYLCSIGIVLDNVAPVISGIENGKIYCEAQTVTVTEKYIESVKVNGTEVTLDANNQFTLNPAEGTQTIVVTDKAGNQTSVSVTVNDGHTYGEWQSNGNNTHTHYCTVTGCDGYEDGDCDGGEATCISKAVCDTCGEEYGELDSANHALENIPAKDATVTATGNKEYWHCKDCKKYFSDAAGTNEIKLDDTIISKLSPEIIEGKGQSITAGEKKELTFKSNAAFSDFIRVELDGKTLDEKYYTVKEGSTVVTLKADYVATLSAGEHTIGIVSTNGTATTTFTVNAKAVADNDTKSPQTGDNSHMALWIALLFVGGGLLTVTGVYGKRKTQSKN